MNIMRNALTELLNGTLKEDGTVWKTGKPDFNYPFHFHKYELMTIRKFIYQEYPWLREGNYLPAQSMNLLCDRLHESMDKFWKKGGFWQEQFGWAPSARKGFPKFIDREDTSSFSYTNQSINFSRTGDKILLNRMSFKARIHRDFDEKSIRIITIKKDSLGKLWICLSAEVQDNAPTEGSKETIVTMDAMGSGMDISDDITKFKVNHRLNTLDAKLKRLEVQRLNLQRQMSQLQEAAKLDCPPDMRLRNFLKTRKRYQKLYRRFLVLMKKIENIKGDNFHKISHTIVVGCDILNIDYTKSAKKIKYAGKAATTQIKTALGSNLHRLKVQMEYKSKFHGKRLVDGKELVPA